MLWALLFDYGQSLTAAYILVLTLFPFPRYVRPGFSFQAPTFQTTMNHASPSVINRPSHVTYLTSCRRAAATICPRTSPPSVGAEAPRAAEPAAPAECNRNVAVGSHGQYVPTLTAAAA